MAKKITYSEPVDYIPKSIRKELGLGEYSPEAVKSKEQGKKAKKSTPKKK